MPKFMTYQRPTPVSKSSWGGKANANPYQPLRRVPQGQLPKPATEQFKLR